MDTKIVGLYGYKYSFINNNSKYTNIHKEINRNISFHVYPYSAVCLLLVSLPLLWSMGVKVNFQPKYFYA